MQSLFDSGEVGRVARTQDCWQTPPQAVHPVLEGIPRHFRIWEPCAGKGNLVREMESWGHSVIASDVQPLYEGVQKRDFFEWEPDEWDMMLTNPPYSLIDDFIERCYQLGKPFALLCDVNHLGGKRRQEMYRANGGVSVIMLGGRLNFETPSGRIADSSATFETCWIIGGCWGSYERTPFGKITFATLENYR